MSIRQTVFSLALVGAFIPAAFASSGSTNLTRESGFEFHAPQSTKSRADVMKELAESKKASASGISRSPTFNSGDSGLMNDQHSYAIQQGQLIHTDTFSHDTPKPSLVMTEAERLMYKQLYRN